MDVDRFRAGRACGLSPCNSMLSIAKCFLPVFPDPRVDHCQDPHRVALPERLKATDGFTNGVTLQYASLFPLGYQEGLSQPIRMRFMWHGSING